MLIAMALMVMVLSAAVLVSFGNQGFLIGGETSSEAMGKAQELLEGEQAQARKDFNLVNSIASTTDGIYEKAVYTRLLPDFLTKEVKALISWKNERQLTRNLEVTTLIANFETPVGGSTCDSSLPGTSALPGYWHTPTVVNGATDFATLVGDPAGTYTLADVDAYIGRLYVVANSTSASNKETLFVFDISNPSSPSLIGKIDNEGAGGTVSQGPNAVRISKDPVSGNTYAYLGNGYNANYATCTPGPRCAELQVANVTSMPPTMTANLMLASSTAPFVTGPHRGNALFYRNGYLLLGLSSVGGSGPEFHIMDVHSVSTLSGSKIASGEEVGNFTVANDVNALTMRGTYAYIGSPNTRELQILNVTNPASPSLAGYFDSPSGSGNGKSLALIGNTLYLGVTVPNVGSDFHILDNTNPGAALPELGPGIDIPSSVNGLIVRDYLSFLLTNTDLRIYRTDTPSSPTAWGALALPASGSATEPSLDCEGNYLYVTANDATNHGKLYVVTSSP